jgi:hypothetical protein
MTITTLVLTCAAAVIGLGAGAQKDAWRVDDFEDGNRVAASGLSWGIVSDAAQGGATRASVDVVAGGAAGSKKALRVSGTLAEKGFAGAWVALESGSRSVDASAFSGVRLRARGDGAVLVGVRGGMPFVNYMARQPLTREWTLLELPFASLAAPGAAKPFDAHDVRWLGVQAAPDTTGAFSFEFDDVELVGATSAPAAAGGPAFTMRVPVGKASELPAGIAWRELAQDAAGDGARPGLPDARTFSVYDDAKSGRVWFRVGLAEPPPAEGFGMNIVLDLDGRQDNGREWWGANKAFRFDRLVTAFVQLRDGDVYQGTFGVADADAVFKGEMADARFEMPRLIVDEDARALYLGVPKAALGASPEVSALAAVGSAFLHNDDVPDKGSARLGR